MAGAPNHKIYTADGEYIASCKYLEDAAVLVFVQGKGATVRWSHKKKCTLWHEGFEDQSAAESYDYAADVMRVRRNDMFERKAYL